MIEICFLQIVCRFFMEKALEQKVLTQIEVWQSMLERLKGSLKIVKYCNRLKYLRIL